MPQVPPPSRTLDLSGRCLLARQVGGDYFDFLRPGDGRLGIVVADISGKGIAAALLMANLQASVRSQSAIAPDDPQRFVVSLNRHFVANSAPAAYASLFFAEWTEASGRLRYVKCGHPPALVLRRDGRIDELRATCTVLGLFGDWECVTAETTVAEGETLVIYTDGVTEWVDAKGAEFGSDRLGDEVRRGTTMGAAALLDRIIAALHELGGEGQRRETPFRLTSTSRSPWTPPEPGATQPRRVTRPGRVQSGGAPGLQKAETSWADGELAETN